MSGRAFSNTLPRMVAKTSIAVSGPIRGKLLTVVLRAIGIDPLDERATAIKHGIGSAIIRDCIVENPVPIDVPIAS